MELVDGGKMSPERKDIIRHTTDGQILITSYDLLKRDVEYYKNIVFAVQVIDEAQYIKNAGTQAAKGVKKITAAFKLALTGTPIENRLSGIDLLFQTDRRSEFARIRRCRYRIAALCSGPAGKKDVFPEVVQPMQPVRYCCRENSG